MKRILAAVGAGALGVTGTVTAAAPAHAAAPAPCETSDDQVLDPDATAGGDWYLPCVPRYGAGKAELSFSSAEGLPAGFDPNDAEIVTAVDDADASAYTGRTVEDGFYPVSPPKATFSLWGTPTETQRTYFGGLVLEVAAVSRIDPGTLPAGCLGDYDSAYRISYVPRTITVSQTIDGTTYRYRGTAGTEPLLVGFSIVGSPATVDEDAPACAVVGSAVTYGAHANTFQAFWEAVVGSGEPGFPHGAAFTASPLGVGGGPDVTLTPLYTASFDDGAGGPVVSADVAEGEAIPPPQEPTRDGYDFAGWYTAASGGERWDFSTTMTADVRLYAHWTPVPGTGPGPEPTSEPTVTPAPEPAEEAELAASGLAIGPPLGAGILTLLLGIGVLVRRARRRPGT